MQTTPRLEPYLCHPNIAESDHSIFLVAYYNQVCFMQHASAHPVSMTSMPCSSTFKINLAMSSAAEHSGLDNRLTLVAQRPRLPINIHLQQTISLNTLDICTMTDLPLLYCNISVSANMVACRYTAVTSTCVCQGHATTNELPLKKWYLLSNMKGMSRLGYWQLSQGTRKSLCT